MHAHRFAHVRALHRAVFRYIGEQRAFYAHLFAFFPERDGGNARRFRPALYREHAALCVYPRDDLIFEFIHGEGELVGFGDRHRAYDHPVRARGKPFLDIGDAAEPAAALYLYAEPLFDFRNDGIDAAFARKRARKVYDVQPFRAR